MAATMFGVSDFMSKIGNKGMFAKRNKFTVEITKPVTKWSHCVKDPNEVNDVMYEARVMLIM